VVTTLRVPDYCRVESAQHTRAAKAIPRVPLLTNERRTSPLCIRNMSFQIYPGKQAIDIASRSYVTTEARRPGAENGNRD
jgi:hypothetical protein